MSVLTPPSSATRPARTRRERRVRAAALVALLAGLAAVAYIVFAGGGGTQYSLIFQNAGQLVVGNQVQIGGVPHGSVDAIELTKNNQAKVVITVDDQFTPLHVGTTAQIRSPSLSGVANRYVSLQLGPNNAPALPDGATLNGQETQGIVDLDQLFNTFDTKTRKALQQFIQGQGTQFADVAAGLQKSAYYFSPALSTSSQLFGKLVQDQQVFKDFLRTTGQTMQVLATTAPQLDQLVGNSAQTFAATATQQQALQQGVAALPATFRQGHAALSALSDTLPDLRKLVAATKPATPGLAPFLKDLNRLFTGLDPVLRNVGGALSTTSPSIVSATKRLPALQQDVGPMTKHSLEALGKLTPILGFVRPYGPDLTAFFKGFGQAAAAYDANGHYVRASPNFNDYQTTDVGTLTPNPPTTPFAGTQTGQTRRCPGAAVAPTADGSAPFDTGQCNPKQVPAG